MPGRVVEIAEDGRSLHLDRGFLAIRDRDRLIGRVALDEIDAVLVSSPTTMWSNNALAALAERGAPVVVIGKDYAPTYQLVPLIGTHDQADRIEAQAAATKPMQKRLWSDIVRAKIRSQAAALETVSASAASLHRLALIVRSGDPDNREAQAAAYYWPRMIGKGFVRSDVSHPANAMLNYGYAVLRAATARAVVAAGLHPSLSLHHRSSGDGLRLADDLMEPFRPAFDIEVRRLMDSRERELTPAVKRRLVSVLYADFDMQEGRSPMSIVLVRLAQSLDAVFRRRHVKLALPDSPLPISPGADAP